MVLMGPAKLECATCSHIIKVKQKIQHLPLEDDPESLLEPLELLDSFALSPCFSSRTGEDVETIFSTTQIPINKSVQNDQIVIKNLTYLPKITKKINPSMSKSLPASVSFGASAMIGSIFCKNIRNLYISKQQCYT